MGTLLPEKVYHHLRRKLLAGEFHPGARLDYKQIATDMGVSTTPVREAMGKLASEGLIELVPRAGAIVRKLGREEALQLYGVREAIETYAAAKAAEKITTQRLEHLDGLLAKMRHLVTLAVAAETRVMTGVNFAEFLDSDLAFHMTIIEAAGNSRLTKLAGDSHILSQIFGSERFGHDLEVLEEAGQFHQSIFDALKERNATKASQQIARHIHRSLELTVLHLDHADQDSWWRNHSSRSKAGHSADDATAREASAVG